MKYFDSIMEYVCGYNYCDGECMEGCLQWCIIIIIYWLCKLGFNDDD